MPLVANTDVQEEGELDELIAFMEDQKIDTSSEDDMMATADVLRKISNNKSLVADVALKSIKERFQFDPSQTSYGPQSIMLHLDRRQNFYIRANFWPSQNDHIFKASRAKTFFYHVPHDHNFNFMTVGHIGPGYESNYFEYEYEDVDGYVGENVKLKFVERSSLKEGKVMLYRAYRDVHDQIPGESMSMSINIMENTLRGAFMDQYEFSTESGQIVDLINTIPARALLSILALSDTEESEDLLMDVAKRHKSGYVRCIAVGAMASAKSDLDEARSVYAMGEVNDQEQVRGFCKNRMKQLDTLLVAE